MQPQPFPYIVPKCLEQIDILYEDEALLLINKPAFLLSMPGKHPENQDSVITRLRDTYPSASLVHRLDLDTSGIMIIPKTKVAHAELSRCFQKREIHKHYTAEVYGRVSEEKDWIHLPLKKDWEHPPLQKVCFEQGKPSSTFYQVIERKTQTTRLALYPKTGRTHQLRLHCQAIGHEIIGCDLYASDEAFHLAKRLKLHATTIRFKHPMNGRFITGFSAVPF